MPRPRTSTRRKLARVEGKTHRYATWGSLEAAADLSRATLEAYGVRPEGEVQIKPDGRSSDGYINDPLDDVADVFSGNGIPDEPESDVGMCGCPRLDAIQEGHTGHLNDCPEVKRLMSEWLPPVRSGTQPHTTFARVRDSQRQRVYDSERVWREEYWGGVEPTFNTVDEAEQYLLDLLDHPEIQRRFGGAAEFVADRLTVLPLSKRATATAGQATPGLCHIRLSEDSLSESTALHELAHLLAAAEIGEADHGDMFTNAILNLADVAIGTDAAQDLEDRYNRRGAKSVTMFCQGCVARRRSIAELPEKTWRRPPLCDFCLPLDGTFAGSEDDNRRWSELRSRLAVSRYEGWVAQHRVPEEDKPEWVKETEFYERHRTEMGQTAFGKGLKALKVEAKPLREKMDRVKPDILNIVYGNRYLEEYFYHSNEACAMWKWKLKDIIKNEDFTAFTDDTRQKAQQCLDYLQEHQIEETEEELGSLRGLIREIADIEKGKPSSLRSALTKQKAEAGFTLTHSEQKALSLLETETAASSRTVLGRSSAAWRNDEDEWVITVPAIESAREAAMSEDTDASDIADLASHPSAMLRRLAVKHRKCPPEHLNAAANDPDLAVRVAAVAHPECPANTRYQAASDPNWEIRAAVASNPSIDADTLARLADDDDFEVIAASAANPKLPTELIERLEQSPYRSILAGVVSNPNTPPDMITRIASENGSDIEIGCAAAKTLRSPLDALLELVSSKRRYIRIVLASRPGCPTEVLEKLAADSEPEVAELAKRALEQNQFA